MSISNQHLRRYDAEIRTSSEEEEDEENVEEGKEWEEEKEEEAWEEESDNIKEMNSPFKRAA